MSKQIKKINIKIFFHKNQNDYVILTFYYKQQLNKKYISI